MLGFDGFCLAFLRFEVFLMVCELLMIFPTIGRANRLLQGVYSVRMLFFCFLGRGVFSVVFTLVISTIPVALLKGLSGIIDFPHRCFLESVFVGVIICFDKVVCRSQGKLFDLLVTCMLTAHLQK